ncbi:MAG: S-isoprenylcysteine methyltransferase [Deltaproteobacteria bacterium]|nr:S-isoprenylcysteine methyltransferase [Deltaproteobacteria bacterium]
MIRLGNLLFRYRDFIFPAAFLILVFGTRPHPLFGNKYLDIWMDALGMTIALAGQILRALVIGFAYIRRGGKNKQIYADRLVQEGFFAHCRNPLYLGNFMIVLGLGIVANSVWFYMVGIPFFIAGYTAIIMAEEDFLRRRFGKEYEEYCQRVNRFIPNFKGLQTSLQGMAFNWKRLISKEYGTTFTWMACTLLLMIWERYYDPHYQAQRAEIIGISLLFIPLVFAYATARYLKKTGRLH